MTGSRKMRLLLIFIFGASAVFALPFIQVEDDTYLEDPIIDAINKTINQFIQNLSDPFTPEDVNMKFEYEGVLTGTFNTSSILVNGVRQMFVSQIKVDTFNKTANITLNMPMLIGNFKYGAKGLLMDLIPLYGSGDINVIFHDIGINLQVPTALDDFKNSTVLFSLGDAVFNLQGILNNPEFTALLNTALDDNFAVFVNHNNKVISKMIVYVLQKIFHKGLYEIIADY